MKQFPILLAASLLGMASCRPSNTDGANDAGGTASPYEARQVVGVRMLSSDALYEKASTLLAEDLVRGTFELGGDTEMTVIDEVQGGKFMWGKNEVAISFATPRPYSSIYHAEHAFDRMYQSKPRVTAATDMNMALESHPVGFYTQGTASEFPVLRETGSASGRDASAKNDTATTVSGITAAATQLTEPAVNTPRFMAYPGLGDKAVWDASTKAMHILLNNHILTVRVNTSDNMTVSRERAAILANVMLNEVLDSH